MKYVEPIRLVLPVDHTQQGNATWGLDRIDQRALPLDAVYVYSGTGVGVTAYIIDTGILTSHNEFGGRASIGIDITGGDGQDCTGHGTHVAGTIGGSTYGVAKAVDLVAVRVLDCDPFTQDSLDELLSGIDWVIANHATPAVANVSLAAAVFVNGVPRETTDVALDDKVADLITVGVPVAVAAGNENKDACTVSPARVPAAITAAASNWSDTRWLSSSTSGSNVGTCVDLFAPGQGITSAWWSSQSATHTGDGTSFAAPHVAGAAALYLQRVPNALPSDVAAAITSRATQGVITNAGTGSPNRLLHSFFVEVTISGPTDVCGTATWSASPTGVGTSYTYRWETADGPTYRTWTLRGTGQTLTISTCPTLAPRILRVTATAETGFHDEDRITLFHTLR